MIDFVQRFRLLTLTTLGFVSACGGGDLSTAHVQAAFASPMSTPTAAQTASLFGTVRESARAITTPTGTRQPTATELFVWAENSFANLFPKGNTPPSNQTYNDWVYRYYPQTDTVLGVNQVTQAVLGITQFSSASPNQIPLAFLSTYTCNVLPAECHFFTHDLPLAQKAGALTQQWGKPKRLLVGLGGTLPLSSVQHQALTPDIYEHYLVGLTKYSYAWDQWNSPAGAYVGIFASRADQLGAIPMFTLYQMATWGDGNIYGLYFEEFMTNYWDSVRLLFQQIKQYGKTTLVNFEPDFWGYAQLNFAQHGTKIATQQKALVKSVNPDCANQPDTVAGMGQCLVQMARALAPNAYIGFPPSMFPGIVTSEEITYMKDVGADKADFVVMQTLDRDAGCFEAAYTGEEALCTRSNPEPYWWDASNQTTPSFTSHFALARRYHEGLGLPLIWWQTPLGVPSATAGGTKGAFRDNRVEYFLTKPQELVAAGGAGVVFSEGHPTQTTIDTDGGQFKRLSTRYFAAPAALP